MKLPPAIFVTGTDTGIGKTLVSAILMAGLKTHYWKPIQSGCIDGTDTDWVREKTGLPQRHFIPEAFKLSEPLSPHAAAAIDGISLELSSIHLPQEAASSGLIVEGAGGLMVPINEKHLMVDLIQHLGLPALVVTRSTLGTINHTILTVEELRRRAIPIVGLVMNGPRNESNRQSLEHYTQTKVIAQIEPLNSIEPKTLLLEFNKFFLSPAAVN